MKILKFGGSSVGTVDRVKSVLDIVQEELLKQPVHVVVSAFQGVTDQLIEMAALASHARPAYMELLEALTKRHRDTAAALLTSRRNGGTLGAIGIRLQELEDVLHGIFLVKELSARTLDFVMSFGELLSAFIISEAFKDRGTNAEFLDARRCVFTDNHFGAARVNFKETNRMITEIFKVDPQMRVITGFIGSTTDEVTTTLGRGGSDYTASIFGAALGASEIEIWTDVDGVMTADPRKVQRAFPIESMSYEEAMEMSHFGAKIIHPPTMQPARHQKIPLRIKNTFHPKFRGTLIADHPNQSQSVIKGLSSIPHVSLLTVQGSGMIGIAGISNRLFGALATRGISVILITQASSEHSICVAVDPKSAADARDSIEQEFSLEIMAGQIDEVVLEPDLAIIAIVGENMRHTPGISGRLFQALGRHQVNVVAIAQGSSELNISVVIQRRDESRALNAVHDTFFLPGLRTIHLYLAGCGLIGGALLKEVHLHHEKFVKSSAVEVQLRGLMNSRRMLLQENATIDPGAWRDSLERCSREPSLEDLLLEMQQHPDSIFVDCTASDSMLDWYLPILKSGIPIVTSNKRPLTGSYQNYQAIRSSAPSSFLYETTVGAGLPVVSTLRDLIRTGDRILKIEAVLSGTLSYLFNSFGPQTAFSDLVQKARKAGYTEPDPREDLSGSDVARKLLILARETGLVLEISDIAVENLVPESCREAAGAEAFLSLLKKEDAAFEMRRSRAEAEGKVLRYIARIIEGKASVSLEAVGPEHAFYNLTGSDNIIAFTTDRYRSTPLVVRGPGAGPEVTAAGVLADILRLGMGR